MAEKLLRAKSYDDWRKGTWQDAAESIVPENSSKLNLNLDSDDVLGELVSRLGTTIVGSQIIDAKPILGLHNFRDSVGSGSKLFAVVSDGTYNDIYDVLTGAKSLENDTKDNKTRFLTYLDSCLRLNGVDAPKAWNGSAWISTGGAFDLANMPTLAKGAIEFKDRVYLWGFSNDPDKVHISGIANATTRVISWTVDNRFIVFEQEDGGGGITAMAKVPGYVLVWKKRTMKRYDGSSAYPEDMVNQGAPSQEAVVVAAQTAWWINENGAWASQGGVPKKISSYTVEKIIKSISATNLLNVASGTDEDHVYWSFSSVTISRETYTNIVLKYNILQNSWDVRKYPTLHRVYARYVDDTGAVFTLLGDDDGTVYKLDVGNSDNGSSIFWAQETHPLSFGYRMFLKSISRIGFITENVSGASVMWRTTDKPEDWKSLGAINGDYEFFDKQDLRGNKFEFKISGKTDTGRAKLKSIEFPEGIKVFSSNN